MGSRPRSIRLRMRTAAVHRKGTSFGQGHRRVSRAQQKVGGHMPLMRDKFITEYDKNRAQIFRYRGKCFNWYVHVYMNILV